MGDAEFALRPMVVGMPIGGLLESLRDKDVRQRVGSRRVATCTSLFHADFILNLECGLLGPRACEAAFDSLFS
jgi:hypothetical protein